jgi:hypothetical protein
MHQIKKMFTVHTWVKNTTVYAQCLEIPEIICDNHKGIDPIHNVNVAIKAYLKNKLNNELNNDKVKVDEYLQTLLTVDPQILGTALYNKGGYLHQVNCFCNGDVDGYVSAFLLKLYETKVANEINELLTELARVGTHEIPSDWTKTISYNQRVCTAKKEVKELVCITANGLSVKQINILRNAGKNENSLTKFIQDVASNGNETPLTNFINNQIQKRKEAKNKIIQDKSEITTKAKHKETFIGEIIRTGKSEEDATNAMLYAYLVFWKELNIPAPLNELQSIQGWLRYLGEHGLGATKSAMRKRMILLQNAAMDLHEAGKEAEDKAGIYQNVSRDKFEEPVASKAKFTVSIATMNESSGTRYFVCLRNNELRDLLTEEQRKGIMFMDPEHGIIEPHCFANLDHANQEAKEWADFLQVSFTPHVESNGNGST